MKLLFITIFFGIAVSNCGQKAVTQTETTEQSQLAAPTSLPFGKSVTHNGINLKFIEVLEDSRCPTGTTCVWAGRAIAKIEVTTNNKTETKTVIFGATRPGEETNLQLYSGNGMALTAESINPHPDQNGAIPENDYVIEISVE